VQQNQYILSENWGEKLDVLKLYKIISDKIINELLNKNINDLIKDTNFVNIIFPKDLSKELESEILTIFYNSNITKKFKIKKIIDSIEKNDNLELLKKQKNDNLELLKKQINNIILEKDEKGFTLFRKFNEEYKNITSDNFDSFIQNYYELNDIITSDKIDKIYNSIFSVDLENYEKEFVKNIYEYLKNSEEKKSEEKNSEEKKK
jgi:hypothetical protein